MLNRFFGPLFAAPPENDRIHVVSAAEIRTWLQANEAMLVDVRESREFDAEHIPGARSMPLSIFDPARISIPEGKKLVIHCRSGARCGMAAARLAAAGWDGEIYRMQGGIIGWKSIGGPTRAG